MFLGNFVVVVLWFESCWGFIGVIPTTRAGSVEERTECGAEVGVGQSINYGIVDYRGFRENSRKGCVNGCEPGRVTELTNKGDQGVGRPGYQETENYCEDYL